MNPEETRDTGQYFGLLSFVWSSNTGKLFYLHVGDYLGHEEKRREITYSVQFSSIVTWYASPCRFNNMWTKILSNSCRFSVWPDDTNMFAERENGRAWKKPHQSTSLALVTADGMLGLTLKGLLRFFVPKKPPHAKFKSWKDHGAAIGCLETPNAVDISSVILNFLI